MFFQFILLVVSSLTFLCTHQESSHDLNCTDYPVFTPSRLVVKYGDPANATCVACQRDCNGNHFDLEKAWGEVRKNGTTLLWTIVNLTEWDIFIQCYYNTDDGDQCISKLELTVYQPPESVSISFVNHTGPMFEHQQYRLQCSVQNVAPVQNLTVTFYRGTKALDQLQSNSEEKKPVNKIFTLNITASKEDDGALYWCEAKLELGPDGPQPPPVVKSEKLPASVYYLTTTTLPTTTSTVTTTPPTTTRLPTTTTTKPTTSSATTTTPTTTRLPTTTTTKPTTSSATTTTTTTTTTTAVTAQMNTKPNSGSNSKSAHRFLCLMLLFSALI